MRPYVVTGGGVILALIIGFLFADTRADSYQYAGVILQVGGLFATGYGIEQARRRAGHAPWWRVPYNQFREWSKPKKDVRDFQIEITAVASAKLRMSRSRPEYIPSKLSQIESEVDQMKDLLQDLDDAIQNESTNIKRQTSALKNDLHNRIAELDERLKAIPAEGITAEVVGLFWIGTGLLFGNLA